MENRVTAIQNILASIFASQKTLKILAPEFNWSGLGNLLGDFGELIAIDAYGLTKSPSGSNGFDAIGKDGRSIQIKTNHAASQIGFRGNADILLVIKVTHDANWTEVYFGPFEPVVAASRFSSRDSKNMVAISKLRKLQVLYGFDKKVLI